MIKVNIIEGILNKYWYSFKSEDNDLRFKTRVISFERLDLNQVDSPNEVEVDEGGQYWIMKMEVVNLGKRKLDSGDMVRSILLIDQDDCEFSVKQDSHLCCYSDYSKTSGLSRFYSEDLSPKIQTIGAVPFMLPKDEKAKYHFGMEDGEVKLISDAMVSVESKN